MIMKQTLAVKESSFTFSQLNFIFSPAFLQSTHYTINGWPRFPIWWPNLGTVREVLWHYIYLGVGRFGYCMKMPFTAKHGAIVSKHYCSSSKEVFMVRNRPRAVNGGGFVVTNSRQEVVFKVDGCGTLGIKGELVVKDENGAVLLLIHNKGGIVEAVSPSKRWNGYMIDYEGASKLVFRLKESSHWIFNSTKVRIYVEPKSSSKNWDFEVKGSFVDRDCNLYDRKGNPVAQVRTAGDVALMESKDVYYVVVEPELDQAFVFGVIAILDNINHQSTACYYQNLHFTLLITPHD